MLIKKQNNKIYIFSLVITCFFVLTGFEFVTVQNDLNSAEQLIEENKYAQAEEILDSITNNLNAVNESSPEMEKMAKNILTPQMYYRLGEIQYKQNKYENAIPYFNNVINFEIRTLWDIKAIYYLGMSEFNLKKYIEAREHYSRLLNDHKDSNEAAEGLYYTGISYELENDKEQEIDTFKKFLELYSGHPWAGKVRSKIGQ